MYAETANYIPSKDTAEQSLAMLAMYAEKWNSKYTTKLFNKDTTEQPFASLAMHAVPPPKKKKKKKDQEKPGTMAHFLQIGPKTCLPLHRAISWLLYCDALSQH
jgi:hypothetical protein